MEFRGVHRPGIAAADGRFRAALAGTSLVLVALLALIPWAIAVDIFAPAQQRRMVELAPDMRGLVLALNSSALFAGMAAGGYLAGRIVSVRGLMALPAVSIALAAACLLLLWISKRGSAAKVCEMTMQ